MNEEREIASAAKCERACLKWEKWKDEMHFSMDSEIKSVDHYIWVAFFQRPTEHFAVLEPWNQSITKFYVAQKRWSAEFKALKNLWNDLSGGLAFRAGNIIRLKLRRIWNQVIVIHLTLNLPPHVKEWTWLKFEVASQRYLLDTLLADAGA